MYKVVYNACYGGYGLSLAAYEMLRDKYGLNFRIDNTFSRPLFHLEFGDLERHDARLVDVVETLGNLASGDYARLKVAEISGRLYRIDEYDGYETVVEPSQYEWTLITT